MRSGALAVAVEAAVLHASTAQSLLRVEGLGFGV